MRYKIFLICALNIIPFSSLSEETMELYQPTLSAEKVLDFADWHNKQDNHGFEKYNLINLSYSFDSREWYLLYSDGKKIFITITINDLNPCHYEVF